MTMLTQTENSKLRKYEDVIQRGKATFLEVGNALLMIRDEKLYRQEHATFEEYCSGRWGFSRPRAYQLIESAAVVENLSTNGRHSEPPANERQIREVAKAPTEKQSEVWQAAVETAPKGTDGKPKVTAQHVRETREKVLGDAKVENGTEPKEPEIPKKLEPVFEAREEFRDALSKLKVVQGIVTKLIEAPGGARIQHSAIKADLDNARRHLRFAMPHSVCPYCKAKKPKCDGCKGTGWVTEGILKQSPKEMQ